MTDITHQSVFRNQQLKKLPTSQPNTPQTSTPLFSGEILGNPLNITSKIKNEHILLCQYFMKIFQVPPRYVYIDKTAIFIFLSKQPFNIVMHKMHMEMNYFAKNFTKRIYILPLGNTIGELITSFFPTISFSELKAEGESIYAFLPDHQMPLALGKEGSYIHLVNKVVKEMAGNYTIYLRSRDLF